MTKDDGDEKVGTFGADSRSILVVSEWKLACGPTPSVGWSKVQCEAYCKFWCSVECKARRSKDKQFCTLALRVKVFLETFE